MSRKNKEQPVVEDLLIEDIAAEGKALAHLDGKVVFTDEAGLKAEAPVDWKYLAD